MTLLTITLLLGIAVLVSGFPIHTGYGPAIYRTGFGGEGLFDLGHWDVGHNGGNWDVGHNGGYWDVGHNGGNWDVGHNGGYWDHPYAEDNNGFDGPYVIMDRNGISDERLADIYGGHGPVSNNYVDTSNDMFRNYGRRGAEFGEPILF